VSAPAARYSGRVLQLFRELPRAGVLEQAGSEAVAGEVATPDRGAWVRFEALRDGRRIADCRFQAWGCPHTLAAAALAASRLSGATLEEASAIRAADLARELEAPAEKLGRLLVVEDAIHALIAGLGPVQ
jgi:NifU-like protein involved in Fe-S cluster formation